MADAAPGALRPDQGENKNPLAAIDPAWAWAAYRAEAPEAGGPWNRELAAHLYRRAGFAATWSQLDDAVAAGCLATVERLMTGEGPTADGQGAEGFYAQAARSAESLLGSGNPEQLAAWWLHVLIHTPHPLRERMTLFWHGHFATSAAKVSDMRMMYAQNGLLRKNALGRFGPLLDQVSKDPAMLIWLDSTTNHKAHPNENFAREVMELFCLGIGNYSEHDIKEAARAFTGWELRQNEFRFNRHQHDAGQKTVLGQTGAWTGDDVLRILLEQPATGRFLARKLFRYLVSETAEPPAALLEPLAAGLREHEYDLSWLVRTVLTSNLFYSAYAVRQRVKGPVELAVGLLRSLEASASTYALHEDLKKLGQGVLFPPNVKGWDGGTAWINSSTLVGRANLVWAIVNRDGRVKARFVPEKLAALTGADQPAEIATRLEELLLACPLPDEVQVQLASIAAADDGSARQRLGRLMHAIATLPEYQLG
ncbi:MAG TPA: DUF1800 domain-containing protein [Pirellulales bacterium]|jgi:hypothetical protein|nr:DUF1800 domain-containing protein [Pirellulales bacterium]